MSQKNHHTSHPCAMWFLASPPATLVGQVVQGARWVHMKFVENVLLPCRIAWTKFCHGDDDDDENIARCLTNNNQSKYRLIYLNLQWHLVHSFTALRWMCIYSMTILAFHIRVTTPNSAIDSLDAYVARETPATPLSKSYSHGRYKCV